MARGGGQGGGPDGGQGGGQEASGQVSGQGGGQGGWQATTPVAPSNGVLADDVDVGYPRPAGGGMDNGSQCIVTNITDMLQPLQRAHSVTSADGVPALLHL